MDNETRIHLPWGRVSGSNSINVTPPVAWPIARTFCRTDCHATQYSGGSQRMFSIPHLTQWSHTPILRTTRLDCDGLSSWLRLWSSNIPSFVSRYESLLEKDSVSISPLGCNIWIISFVVTSQSVTILISLAEARSLLSGENATAIKRESPSKCRRWPLSMDLRTWLSCPMIQMQGAGHPVKMTLQSPLLSVSQVCSARLPWWIPEPDCLVNGCRCKEVAIQWKCHCSHPIWVSLKCVARGSRGWILEPACPIHGCWCKELAIRWKCHCSHPFWVSLKSAARGSYRWIPEPDCLVPWCRGNELAIRWKCHGRHPISVPAKSAMGGTCWWIPEPDCTVLWPRGKELAIRWKCHRHHFIWVSFKSCAGSSCRWIPKSDRPVMWCRGKEQAIQWECHPIH